MIEQISIDGVMYAATPTTAPALGDKVVTIDGVIYIIGEPVTSGRSAVPGEIDRATVNGAEFDLRDSILAPSVQSNATAIANEVIRAKQAEQSNATAIANEVIRAKQAEQSNATAIANEVTRAKDAEKALSDRIDNIPTGGGGGTGEIADGAVTEKKLSIDVANKLNTAYDKADLADTLLVNDGITFIKGALEDTGEVYQGTNYRATSLPIYTGGEKITVDRGYKITKYVLYFDGEAADSGVVNMTDFDSFELAGTESAFIRIEVCRTDNNAIRSNEYPNIVKSFIRKPVAWSASCNMNNFVCAGDYRLSGSRVANAQDNMPIYNAGNIEAKLEVLVDGTMVAQKLTLLNSGGGDGNVYTRVKQDGTWQPWGKLQTNIEVGRVEGSNAFDGFIDNGMYSGVYAYDNNAETFVLVVLNAYLYGGGISQLKYSLTLDGTVSIKTRKKTGDTWSEWTDK